MTSFIVKRGINALLTILVIITLTFMLMHLVPGGPFTGEKPVPPAVLENLNKYYHLDEPLWKQYLRYVGSLLQGDLGPSYKSQTRDVNQMLADTMPVSIQLGLQALIVAVIGGLFLGIIAALYHNKIPDRFATILAVVGTAVPSFVVATLMIKFLAVELKWFPIAQWKTWKHTVMPTIALAALPMAQVTRLMRSNMLEVLNQDYIKTAKAKGLARVTVIVRHTIRNAILPVVTILGPITANLLTGTFVIEKIFSIPGAGKMIVEGIGNRDYPVIMGTTVVYGVMLVIILFIVDLLYSLIDPRIKLKG
ncbi:ABC transporter permease [Paenibacillus turpanensis]|uniref:ABC transporter permease n=1 Tax=Paenibacillus turpanensis TaxID=2689078 RepID=UPI00140E8AAE|nr:ABC transporter permease [Paenibacillus turpanensis]